MPDWGNGLPKSPPYLWDPPTGNPKLVQREVFKESKVLDSDPRETQEDRVGNQHEATHWKKVLTSEVKGFWNRMDKAETYPFRVLKDRCWSRPDCRNIFWKLRCLLCTFPFNVYLEQMFLNDYIVSQIHSGYIYI